MIMNYEEFQEQLVDYLSGNLIEEEIKRFEQFLENHPE